MDTVRFWECIKSYWTQNSRYSGYLGEPLAKSHGRNCGRSLLFACTVSLSWLAAINVRTCNSSGNLVLDLLQSCSGIRKIEGLSSFLSPGCKDSSSVGKSTKDGNAWHRNDNSHWVSCRVIHSSRDINRIEHTAKLYRNVECRKKMQPTKCLRLRYFPDGFTFSWFYIFAMNTKPGDPEIFNFSVPV